MNRCRKSYMNRTIEMWTDTNTLLLVDTYKMYPCLWDPTDPHFKIVNRKHQAWKEVASAMQCDVPEIKRKMASVLASFRRERKRPVKSTWFAYEHLSFLLEKFNTPKKRKSTEEEDDDYTEPLEEWWNEHDTLADDSNHLITNLKIEGPAMTDIEYQDDLVSNFSTTVRNGQTNAFADAEDPHLQRKLIPSRKRMRMNKTENRSTNESYQERETVICDCSKNKQSDFPKKRSICDLFADYVAAKMDSYSEQTRILVQHKINEILFQADLGAYDKPIMLQQSSQENSSLSENIEK